MEPNFTRNPPNKWLEERPSWAVSGAKVRVVTEGPDRGRAAGLLAPQPGSVVYMNDASGKIRCPDIGRNHGRAFHSGAWEYTDSSGQLVTRQIGSIALSGGHSDTISAETSTEARDYLSRQGRWQDNHGDLVLHGRVKQTPDGILFLGAAYPWADDQDIDIVNATTLSGEWWYDQSTKSREFIGAARVLRTALPAVDLSQLPVAADLNTEGPLIVCTINPSTGERTCSEVEQPITAEVQESAFSELVNQVSDLSATVLVLQEELFEMAIKMVDPDELTTAQRMDSMAGRLVELEEALRQQTDARQQNPEDANTETAQAS